jgi:hypothetical protein
MSSLRSLEDWYASRCDGDWERSFGITIETLDNPGWAVRIDLAETRLAGPAVRAGPDRSLTRRLAPLLGRGRCLQGLRRSRQPSRNPRRLQPMGKGRAQAQPSGGPTMSFESPRRSSERSAEQGKPRNPTVRAAIVFQPARSATQYLLPERSSTLRLRSKSSQTCPSLEGANVVIFEGSRNERASSLSNRRRVRTRRAGHYKCQRRSEHALLRS